MKLLTTLLALMLAGPAITSAQTIDPETDLTGYTRFIVYPHLQQGLESTRRGDRTRALLELERARSLAPDNATVALYLASGYSTFGEPGRAESLLRDQMTRTPGDRRLLAALTGLPATTQPRATPAIACSDGTARPCGEALPSTAPRASEPPSAPSSSRASVASGPVAPRRQRVSRPAPAPPQLPGQITAAGDTAAFGSDFTLALQTHRFDDAGRQADSLLTRDGGGPALLDTLTYQLVTAGATEQATGVLLKAYPFAGRASAERVMLFQRLLLMIDPQHGGHPDERLSPLRVPLDTPALRGLQAAFWAGFDDCGTARAVLKDMSPDYGHDDWMRLGDCSAGEDPLLAQQAYTKAQALLPGGRASRSLGYQAYANGDFPTALDAWRSVGPGRLSGDELLGAVSTALAVAAPDQAASWLDVYRDRGDTLNHRYWSLVADSSARKDPEAAAAALAHAIALLPEADDYVRLARLESDAPQQVRWLQRAVALDPANSNAEAQLGYAYSRVGSPVSAVGAFERAAALDPQNMDLQRDLGYAYWRIGRAASAQRAFELAFHADPANPQLPQQLVYVHQRLKHNREARAYSELVLDQSLSSDAPADEAAADRRFGFQRLHEDLGRRVTLGLDGWTGTAVGTGTSESQAGSRYRSYSQFEADVRLGNPAIRDGSTLSAYTRVLADGGDLRNIVPSQNAILGLGLRWKPWSRQVIYLAAENQNGLDDTSHRDVLLRASASFLNGGRAGDDWHPSRSGWFSRNLYLDGAHYLESQHSAFTVDYRSSYHRKMAASQTLEPYVHLQFNGARDIRLERDVRGGVGVRWNVWQGASRYDAPPHKISVGVEFQQAFQTYLTERNGVFLTFGTRW